MSIPIIAAIAPALEALGAAAPAIEAGLSVVTTGLGYAGAQQEANNQNAAIKAANNVARKQAIADYDQITIAGKQAVDQAAEKNAEVAKQTAKTVATAKVAAGEGGVSGLSVDALLADVLGQEAGIKSSVEKNLTATGQQLQLEASNTGRAYRSTVKGRPLSAGPSALGAALQAGTGVLSAYRERLKIKE
jgi:hypothetical protein